MSPLFFDVLVAVGLFIVALVSLFETDPAVDDALSQAPDAWNYLVVAVMTLPLVMRRRNPVAVLSVVSMAFIVDRLADYPLTLATWAIPMALHALGSEMDPERSRQLATAFVIGLVGFTALGAVTTDSVPAATVAIMAAFTIFPYVLGREVHERRRRTASLEQRAEEAERRQRLEAQRLVRSERQRIARELHDVVAHEMTVMTIQAAAARRLVAHDPARAADALQAVEAAGHEALNEMRRLLGVLRPEPPETARRPQPGLGRLEDLVVQMGDAGLDVAVEVEGEPRSLPPGVDLNLFRIVQESLTNALKHGGPSTTATVRLAYGDEMLELDIADDGRGASGALAGTGANGQGLVGMRERVALLNGEITTGPRPGGGYRVRTRIPLETA